MKLGLDLVCSLVIELVLQLVRFAIHKIFRKSLFFFQKSLIFHLPIRTEARISGQSIEIQYADSITASVGPSGASQARPFPLAGVISYFLPQVTYELYSLGWLFGNPRPLQGTQRKGPMLLIFLGQID